MNNARKALIELFLAIIIVSTLAHTVLAQKNETKDILQQENKTTTAQNATFSEVAQKSELTKEDIIIESQRSFDRSLSILNIVATLMGVLVGILALIVAVAGAFGFLQIRKWQEVRKNIEKDAETTKKLVESIKETLDKAEKDANMLHSKVEKFKAEEPPTKLEPQSDPSKQALEPPEELEAEKEEVHE